MAVPTYSERSGVEFTAVFEDVRGAPTLPTTVHWRLVGEQSGLVLQDWTQVTPYLNGTDVEAFIEVPGTVTNLSSPTLQRELLTLLVVADKDQAGEYSEPYQFYIRRTRRT